MHALPDRAIKRVSLKEMLRWAYNRQQVDSLTGKIIGEDQNAFSIGAVGGDIVSRFSALGTRVDSAGSNRFAKNDVHPDAELLHDHVLELGPIDARLVIQFGHTGWFPEQELPEAHPARVVPGDRFGIGVWHGEKRRIREAVSEVVTERVETYANKGRKGVELVYTEIVRTEVLYCPLEWHPDPRWCAVTLDVADHWRRVTEALKTSIRAMFEDEDGGRFTEHEITDLS